MKNVQDTVSQLKEAYAKARGAPIEDPFGAFLDHDKDEEDPAGGRDSPQTAQLKEELHKASKGSFESGGAEDGVASQLRSLESRVDELEGGVALSKWQSSVATKIEQVHARMKEMTEDASELRETSHLTQTRIQTETDKVAKQLKKTNEELEELRTQLVEEYTSLETVDGIWDKLRDMKSDYEETAEELGGVKENLGRQEGYVKQIMDKYPL